MKCLSYKRPLKACATLALLSLPTLGAQGQQRLGPDLLQTLGVGSRSIALGNAFSAIADDASATFWNPGRLGFLNKVPEAMLSERSVLNTRFTTYSGVNSVGATSGKPQFGFGSFLYPLDRSQQKGAAIGVSYTLGGYFSNFREVADTPGNNLDPNFRQNKTTVRNSFITVAYGRKLTERLGVGLGVFFVNQDFTTSNRAFGAADSFATERGNGVGVNLGLAYNVPLPQNDKGTLYLGLAYRTSTSLSGLSANVGQGFNVEVPGRLSLGLAREFVSGRGDHVWLSTEFQAIEAANRRYDANGNLSLTDARRAVGNFHFGVEYLPKWLDGKVEGNGYEVPLRMGFHTNSNAAFKYTYYDYVLSLGAAYIRKKNGNLLYSIEPTLELLTRQGTLQVTLTGRFRL